MGEFNIGDVTVGNSRPFTLIAGPCVIESAAHARECADAIKRVAAAAGVPLIFKSSFDKANRTSGKSFRGVGIDEGLEILAGIRADFGLPVLTDVHEIEHCARAADSVDVLQIPAFLCRQTDLIVAAAATGRAVNIKKGQFAAPQDMGHALEKCRRAGNSRVLVTERGTSFGYHDLVVDMRGLEIMTKAGETVIFDATHSCQRPSGADGKSGGDRRFAPVLARAALAVGVAGLFVETHPDPDHAPSDGPNMIPLEWLPELVDEWKDYDRVAKKWLKTRGTSDRSARAPAPSPA
jgi:2-dehydro-3-deoxyphosphooctonate aldolase (KDO 8-P synthase)